MGKRIYVFCAVILLMIAGGFLWFTGCQKTEQSAKRIRSLKELNDPAYTIGCMTGIVATEEAQAKLPKAIRKEYPMPIDAFTALCAGKIDAVVLDRPTLEYMSLAHPELVVMKEDLAVGHISVAAAKTNAELMQSVNEFIRAYRRDGTYRQMLDRWFYTKNSEIPEIENEEIGKPLKVGVTANNEPLCFIKNCKFAGFDSEFSLRLGAYLKRKVIFKDMPYDALVAGLESGKIDLAVAFMDAIPEREESVLFSENYVDAPITILIHKDKYESGEAAPDRIMNAADLNYPTRTIACESEVLSARIARQKIPSAKYLEFAGPPDCYTALASGKAHAIVYDRPPLDYAALARPEFMVLPDSLAMGHISVASAKNRTELIRKVNAFIRKYREDGTYQNMYKRWILTKDSVMPEITKPKAPDGKLVIGITADNPPFSSIKDGKLTGFDIEFSYRLGLFLNKEITLLNFMYDGLISAIVSGKIDLAIAQMDATPERSKSVLFSEEYVNSPIAIMIRKKDYGGGRFLTFEELAGAKIGSLTGSAHDSLAKKHLPKYRTVSFQQLSRQITALEHDKIDAFLIDEPVGRFLLPKYPDFCAMPQKIPCGNYAFLFSKKNPELCKAVSEEIRKMKKNGELLKLQQKWFSPDESGQVLPEQIPTGKILKFMTIPELPPFSYIRNGKITGYELELAILAANRLGYELHAEATDFASFIEQVNTGRCDFFGGCCGIPPEQQKNVLLSEPYYNGGISIIIRAGGMDEDSGDLFERLSDGIYSLGESFDKTFLRENRWKLILQGLLTTVVITFFSVIFGTLLAFPICMMSRSRRPVLSWLASRYVSLIMGTPILVILMILYYVVFAKVDIDGVLVAILAFALDFAAYASVMLKSGIDGVPCGQTEAALALGHTPHAAFFRFVLPQAIRTILPVYRGEIISTLKATSIVGYIAIMDLTKMGDIIRSRTYEAFFPLIAIAVIYFFAAKCLTALLIMVENKVNPEYRRARLQERGVK